MGSEGQVRLFTMQGQRTCPSDPVSRKQVAAV